MSSIGSLLIRNGTVITSERSFASDVRIEGERITEIGPSLSSTEGTRIVDAAGLLVLPGGIDPHVHLSRRPSLPAAACEGDDFLSGSRAALAGGVTTVGEIPSPEGNEGVMDTVGRVEAEVRARSLVDVFVHPVLGSTTHKLGQISALPARGQPSLKLFLMNPALSEHPLGMKQAVQSAADAKVTVLFHCESPQELAAARDGLLQQGKTSLRYLPESRPVIAEVRAVEQAIRLCRETGATGYIVHVSSADALQLCAEARSAGLPIHIETRPEFLHLTAEIKQGCTSLSRRCARIRIARHFGAALPMVWSIWSQRMTQRFGRSGGNSPLQTRLRSCEWESAGFNSTARCSSPKASHRGGSPSSDSWKLRRQRRLASSGSTHERAPSRSGPTQISFCGTLAKHARSARQICSPAPDSRSTRDGKPPAGLG